MIFQGNKRKNLFITFCSLVCLSFLSLGVLQLFIFWSKAELRLFENISLATRNILGQGPGLSQNIKLFAFDERLKVSVDDWQRFFSYLRERDVSGVVFEHAFSDVFSGFRAEELEQLFTPKRFNFIFASKFSDLTPSSQAEMELGLDNEPFKLRRIFAVKKTTALTDYLTFSEKFPLKPAAASTLPDSLSQVGVRLGFASSQFIFQPFLRLTPESLVPHQALYLGTGVALQNNQLVVNDFALPMDARATVVANMDSPMVYERRLQTLLLDDDQDFKDLGVAAQDVVVFVKNTPTSYPLAAVIHSTLTGAWLRLSIFNHWLLMVTVLLSAAAVCLLPTRSMWVVSPLISFGVFMSHILLLVYGHQLVPFVVSAVAPPVVMLMHYLLHVAQVKRTRSEKSATETEFHAPTGRVVTILFIDIVGFSILAESQTPEEVFQRLRDLILRISNTVERFGGVVDNVLGDGLLCFFGYRYDGKDTMTDHADVALECAVEIQKENLRFFETSSQTKQDSIVYPLRMGINTASVFIGDLGGTKQAKATIIGHGVNYAKRLEEACESFRVMVGTATRDLLIRENQLSASLEKRPIQIKHHGQLFEAYEVDPFENEVALREKALNAYRQNVGIERKDTRILMPNNTRIILHSANGDGEVVNFSHSGFAVQMHAYLAKDVNMTISLDSSDGLLGEQLKKSGLHMIVAEVKWGRPQNGGSFLHGCLIKNMSTEQRELLIQLIRSYSRRSKLKISKIA